MMRADLGDSKQFRALLLLVVLLFVLFRAIRRDPRDRVLLCETIAFGSFFVAVAIIVSAQVSGWFAFLCLIPFVVFTILAIYFAWMNWLRRKKRAG